MVDIWPGSSGSSPNNYAVFNNKLYFSANNGTLGYELYSYEDSNGLVLVADIDNGPSHSLPRYLTSFKNKLYFSAKNSNTWKLYSYDDSSGLSLVTNTNSVTDVHDITVFNDMLYFRADENNLELYRYDGSNAPSLVVDIKFDKATDEVVFDVEFQIENLKSQKAVLVEQSILAKSLFNLLLNRNLQEDILIDPDIVNQIDFTLKGITDYQELAMANRLEFQQLSIAKEVNHLNKERIKKEALPSLGVGGGVGLQTEDFDFNNGGPLYTIALSTSISIFDNGLRKKRIEEVRIQDEMLGNNHKQLQQKVAIEVLQVYYNLQSLLSRMTSEASAEKSAQKSLDRFKTKYENDKALLIELLQAENRLTTAQLSKVLTKYDFLIKRAEMDKVVGKD